jgi:hypothetical protein
VFERTWKAQWKAKKFEKLNGKLNGRDMCVDKHTNTERCE